MRPENEISDVKYEMLMKSIKNNEIRGAVLFSSGVLSQIWRFSRQAECRVRIQSGTFFCKFICKGRKTRRIQISRKGSIHVENFIKGVNSERQWDLRALDERGQPWCQCTGNKNTLFPQWNLYHLSFFTAPRRHPSHECSGKLSSS